METERTKIALIGGGPAALFMYKQLLDTDLKISVTVFEKSGRLGAGMPYSSCGAGLEHVTNVSSNEIPELPQTPIEWWESQLRLHGGDLMAEYSEYKVFPRRLFGDYLEAQFHNLIDKGRKFGIPTDIILNSNVQDLNYLGNKVIVTVEDLKNYSFDKVVICTGHQFRTGKDEAATGFYNSPYPPDKLALTLNHPVAIKGASLTAVDAIKTLSRVNGEFLPRKNGKPTYKLKAGSENFKIVLHCRSGMLPSVRFHLADSHLRNPSLLLAGEIEEHRKSNRGFLSLDFIFEKDFLEPLKKTSPEFYDKVRGLTMEEFVEEMLQIRYRLDPFVLLKSECNEAAKSIKRRESIYWKEMLGVLSFAMNYPAKYFSAEDMLRFKATLHPLISLVIAYLPQSSCRELLALHKAGCLDMVTVGSDSKAEQDSRGGVRYSFTGEGGSIRQVNYKTFIDCTGQPQIDFKDFPFKGLVDSGNVTQARLAFRDNEAAAHHRASHADDVETDAEGNYFMKVSGIAVDDCFRAVDGNGSANNSIFMMAVPFMGGYNPDYSGLDFCEEASHRIASCIAAVESQPETVPQRHWPETSLESVA